MNPLAILFALALVTVATDETPARPFVTSLGVAWKDFTRAVNSAAYAAIGTTIGTAPTLGRLVDIANGLTLAQGVSGAIEAHELQAVMHALRPEVAAAPVAQAPARKGGHPYAGTRFGHRADGTLRPLHEAEALATLADLASA